MYNSDNSFCWNPGDYWTCAPDNNTGSFLNIAGGASPYWHCKWANIGSDEYIQTTGTCYTNGQGPGWFELSSTNPAINSDIEHSRFDHFYLDNPNPFRGEYEETVSFVGDLTDVSFDDWYIGPLRTPGYQGFIGAFSTWNNVTFSDWVCPGFTGNGSFFGFSAGYYNNVTIENCNVSGTGAPTPFCGFAADGAPASLNGLYVDNNALSGMGSVLYVSGAASIPVQNISGYGNTIVNPAPGSDMISLDTWTPMPSGISGQFTTPLSWQDGNAYTGAVLMTATAGANFQSPIALVYRSEAAAWVNGVGRLLGSCKYVGSLLALYQNNGNGTTPVQFGPLANNAIGGVPPFLSGTGGAYFSQWEAFVPVPPALTGSGPMTIWAVDSSPDNNGMRGIISFQASTYPYAGFSLEASGTASQDDVFIGPSYAIFSGLPGIYFNQPVGNCFTYDGNLGVTLRTFALSGTADALVTGTLPGPEGSLCTVGNLGLAGRQSLGMAGESETVHDYLVVTAALPDSTVSALKTLWQSCFQEYAATNGGPTVVENPAENVTSFGADLIGTVNPNGFGAYGWFQYGDSNAYGNTTSAQAIGNPTSPAAVHASLSALNPNTTYHYCLTASSGALVVSGSDMTFTTPPVYPAATEGGAAGVTTSSASVSGTVNPGGLDAQVYFVYGLTGTYGSQSAEIDVGNGTTYVAVNTTLAGLYPGETYHYAMVVSNSNGTFYGADQTFSSGTIPPLGSSLAVLKGNPADGVPGTTFASFSPPIVNANGRIAFSALLRSGSTVVTSANNSGIWAEDSGGFRHLIARTSGSAAGLIGATYSSLGNPVYNDNEQIAFMAGLKLVRGASTGIFSNATGTLSVFRIQGDRADGANAGVFYHAFKSLVFTDDSIVFSASLAGPAVTATNDAGIWSTNITTGQTTLVARTGEVDGVTGKVFKTLTIFPVLPAVCGQSRSVDSGSGNIAYLATYTDGTSALIRVIAH
jgi:hypothetical protein